MDLSLWFSDQLNASAEGFIWAIGELPQDRLFVSPPAHPEEWPAARHVFHLLYYEQNVALPMMKVWMGEPSTLNYEDYNEGEAWEALQDKHIEKLLSDFRMVRAEQIVLLQKTKEEMWQQVQQTVWGDKTLKWVVTKTYQHTAEHLHDVLRMVLHWDAGLKSMKEMQEQQE
ncbi:MAG TPA: DinB family protein [Ktedonobacteraceae bacterium]|jgi:hypothetical protein|nr:DinB family protein [Ktedonobacteraceae bacterium]